MKNYQELILSDNIQEIRYKSVFDKNSIRIQYSIKIWRKIDLKKKKNNNNRFLDKKSRHQ